MIPTYSNLMKYAIDYLSKYNSSKANLKKILINKIRRLKIEKKDKFILYNSIDKIIDELEKNNFINDNNYAESKIRLFYLQGKSKMFIKNYFFQKGIEREIINKIFENFREEDSDWEYKSAKIFAKKKKLTNLINNQQKNLSKLSRAGFSYEISKKILEDI